MSPKGLIALDILVAGPLLALVSGFGFAASVPGWTGCVLLGSVVAGHAMTGQYRREPRARGITWMLGQTIIGVVLAAGVTAVLGGLGFGRGQLAAFFVGLVVIHSLVRSYGTDSARREKLVRWSLMAASVTYLFSGYLGRGVVGSGDGYWYSAMMADYVAQWRAGVFPVFVGQTEFAFNGALILHRLAPFLQHAAGIIDLLTWHQLSYLTLLNLVVLLSAVGGMWGAYRCAYRILGGAPWTAGGLALLYISAPAVLALAYTGALYMSLMTLPFLPFVVLGIWRAGKLAEPLPIAASVAPLAAVWYCHPPIALWLHAIFACALAVRWMRLWRAPVRVAGEAAGVCLLFTVLGGFSLASVLTIGPTGTTCDREKMLGFISAAFPAMIAPVSATADQISDYQLGWSLWVLLVGAGAVWWQRIELRTGLLLGVAMSLIVLFLPVPWLTSTIWKHVPQHVINATFFWPMQRLAPILVAVSVLTAAAMWPRFTGRIGTAVASVLLSVGVAWSHLEAGKFLHRGHLITTPRAESEKALASNNILLTRYAFGQFLAAPAYFSHGFVDPVLEHRVLSLDGSSVLFSNRDGVLQTTPNVTTLRSTYDGVQGIVLKPNLRITPGVRHYYRLEWLGSAPAGSIVGISPSVTRVYALPDTGIGMLFLTPHRGFGLLPGNTDGFPVWVPNREEELDLRYMLSAPLKGGLPADYIRVRDYSYRPEQLPIRVHALVPYRVTLESPSSGLLETPRVFVEGYRAIVNGRVTEVRRSPDGLVSIPLSAGHSEITLTYPGPSVLRVAYWLSLTSWVGLAAWSASGAMGAEAGGGRGISNRII